MNNSALPEDRATPPAQDQPKDKQPAGDGAKDAKKDAEKQAEPADAAKQDPKKKARDRRDKEEADRKEVEKQRLRALVKQGAWFYDAAGKALSGDEVTKRIEGGKTNDIKTVDIYQQEWKTAPDKTSTPSKKDGDTAQSGADTKKDAAAAEASK